MGRARTGKSERVLQRIAALGDSSQQILLVPEHASHVAEMDLCRVCGDTASRHAEALTFKLLASRVNWIAGETPAEKVYCTAKTRYSQKECDAVVTPLEGGCAHVELLTPQRAVTAGQAVVFYDGEEVLGGGTIEKAL